MTTSSAVAVGLSFGLAFVPHVIKLGALMYKQRLRYDNAYPRDAITKLEKEDAAGDGKQKPFTNLMKRCLAAHQNGLEGFTGFAAAVSLAVMMKADPKSVDSLAHAYVLSRVFYNVFYVCGTNQGIAWLRTGTWFIGAGCIMKIFVLSATAPGPNSPAPIA